MTKGYEEARHRMYDIHMHIIPGVDDGSWDMDMSKHMLYMAYEQGVRKVVATPHSAAFYRGRNVVDRNFEELQRYVQETYQDLQIYLGCEVRCSRYEIQYILSCLEANQIPSMNGTKYVLTEFGTGIEAAEAVYCASVLKAAGWIPVIAHVERYRKLFYDSDCLYQLQDIGCLFQINVYSVFDENDEQIKRNAVRMVEERMVSFLGSDAHRTFHRPPSVIYGLQYLYGNYDTEYVDSIAYQNAEGLLEI